MSIHRSLAGQGSLVRGRSVLSRLERIQKLEKEGKWKLGESIYGLPKVRTKFKTGAKKKKKEAAPAPGAEGANAVKVSEGGGAGAKTSKSGKPASKSPKKK